MFSLKGLLSLGVIIVTFSIIRLLYVLPAFKPRLPLRIRRGTPTRLLVVLGSGGHTAEMLSLLRDLDPSSYTHRSYVVSSGDDFSAQKALDFEQMLERRCLAKIKYTQGEERGKQKRKGAVYGGYDIVFVPRARKIHQSLLTTPLSALLCLFACVLVLRSPPAPRSPFSSIPTPTRSYPPPSASNLYPLTYPHLILTNGPATATILIFAAILLRFLGLPGVSTKMRVIYVESWARVRKMSLSGKILVVTGMCERVLVQWECLAAEGVGRGGWGEKEFRGVLVE